MDARWDTLTNAEKKAYFRAKVGENPERVTRHFRLDTVRYPFLDGTLDVELSGNWELRSRPFESLEEATAAMREMRKLTGKSAQGFHLHLRDNGVEWFADGNPGVPAESVDARVFGQEGQKWQKVKMTEIWNLSVKTR